MVKKKTTLVPLSGYSSNTTFKENPVYTPQLAYNQSYFEWAAKYREQVFVRSLAITGGTDAFYTVPQGKTLFISSMWLLNYNSSAVASTVVHISTPFGRIIASFLPLAIAGTPNPHETITQSFPFPLKFPAGTIITLTGNSTANSLSAAGFTGWLEYLEA
jgi:hypothetical protein